MLFMMFVFSCAEQSLLEEQELDIKGFWINQETSDTIYTYERSSSLKEGDYGFAFNDGGVFIERKNIGWCGTPPISYGDFEGIWSLQDSIIDITVDFWGGTADLKWKVILLDEQKLSVTWLDQEFNYQE